MKNKLKIEWSNDEYNCDTCGTSYSTGAVVTYNDNIILNIPASAHCFHSFNINYSHILAILLKHLDIEVEEINEDDYDLNIYLKELKDYEKLGK